MAQAQHLSSYDELAVKHQNLRLRVDELLEANNRFEQRGRMAERTIRFLEGVLLDGTLGPTREQMARHLILEYRKDFPKS